jgi:hypothetical protein
LKAFGDFATHEGNSENEITPTEDGILPIESLIPHNGRSKLEDHILFFAGSRVVQTALRQYLLETGKDELHAQHSTMQQAARYDTGRLKQQFMEGVRLVLEASGDRRLEVMHWMLGRLWEDRAEVTGVEIVEWFFVEAEHVIMEADEDEAKEVERIFGSQ